ncbi:MAG: tRNA (adenosine(37)-N6)-threonylcarbamoyltransferase complex ATPase subunit type 1 TsaE [Flavobacteriales bacterium]|jgi:tRNA threonylcarbamoyladenosine biosynthesis protein TsaE|nr:tRNA (adenosine(37)-N6)-threonylcarbamoyltransferase complex ATPase subunit type 1 TsaE [Flavobacteriales bacterium]
MQQQVFNIASIQELDQVALAIKKLCSTHTIFVVDGEMGAGKTTLISKTCQYLNIEDEPSSPTYSIVNTYYSEDFGEINHFDFYRIEDEEEALESGLDEPLYNGSICFVEWAEKISNLLPQNYIKVTIKTLSNTNRQITITL